MDSAIIRGSIAACPNFVKDTAGCESFADRASRNRNCNERKQDQRRRDFPRLPLFSELSESQRAVLLESTRVKTVSKGELLFQRAMRHRVSST